MAETCPKVACRTESATNRPSLRKKACVRAGFEEQWSMPHHRSGTAGERWQQLECIFVAQRFTRTVSNLKDS